MRCRKTSDNDIFAKNALDDDALEQISGGADESHYNGKFLGYQYRATCQGTCHSEYLFMEEDMAELRDVYHFKCPNCGGDLYIEDGRTNK